MNRRSLVRGAGLGAGLGALGAATLAAPALAQSATPEVRWRLTSSFPKSLDTLFGAAEFFAKRVAALTSDRFQIRTFAAGEIVPALQALDAVQSATVECCQTAAYYFVGKDPTFAFDAAVPFGFNSRQHNTWVTQGGGLELMREFYQPYNITSFLMGHTGAQMGGWYRKEIKGPEDLKGLKMRIGGLAGQVLSKVGVVTQQIPGGEIYSALEKGTIDAAEWVGPHDDQKLGFNKVAPIYHYPGWWEGGTGISLYVNNKAYEALPEQYKQAIQSASVETMEWSLSKYDIQNPKALRELIAGGTKIVPFPQSVLEACFTASTQLYAELSAANPRFKKVHDHWAAFRREQVLWFRVTENTYDNFMARQSAQNRL